MEKALLLSPLEAERASGLKVLPCSALIVGSEFCQNQVPDPALLKKLARKFPGTRLSLATSILTDKGLARWEALLGRLPRGLVGEVIFNDWGLLPALKKSGPFSLSADRLLMREFLRIDRGWAADFCKSRGVTRAETDTAELAGAARALGLEVSAHRPLLFTAVTTFCPFERHFKARCAHACAGRLVKLENRHLPRPLFLAEKAYFSPLPGARARPAAARRVVLTLNFLTLRGPGRN